MKSGKHVLFTGALQALHYPVDGLSLTRYNKGVMEVLSSSEELRVRMPSNGKPTTGRSRANEAVKEVMLRMLAEGRNIKECAAALNKSYHLCTRMARDPDFQQKLKDLNAMMFSKLDAELKLKAETTAQRIQEVSDAALDKVLELMDCADSQVVQMRCAQDLLDRNPDTSKTKKVEKTTKTLHLSAEFLHLVETSEREAGTTIDG